MYLATSNTAAPQYQVILSFKETIENFVQSFIVIPSISMRWQ